MEDKEMVTSLLNEWSAGGTNALSLNIGESDAQKYGSTTTLHYITYYCVLCTACMCDIVVTHTTYLLL